MKFNSSSFLFVLLATFLSCSSVDNSEKLAEKAVQDIESGKNNPVISEVPLQSASENALLRLVSTTKKGNTYTFNYGFENFTLKSESTNIEQTGIFHSAEGQHVKVVINNLPFHTVYEPKLTQELRAGTNVVLSFLSSSYHTSLKNKNAYTLSVIENSDVKTINFDKNAPHLFYCSPSGVYKGLEAQKILVDFYLLNTTLSENGNKVILTVDAKEFVITKWAPYVIEGLDAGEHTFSIKLVNSENKLIEGPFNLSGERKITIEQ
jgi:hypothetical protein